MKLLIVGPTGALGQRVARIALERFPPGSVTLFVRNKDKLASLISAQLLERAQIVVAEISDTVSLQQAMTANGACICTAGNANTHPTEFPTVFKGVVDAAASHLGAPKRLWMMAGVTLMDVPGAEGLTFNDLPIFSHLKFVVHTANHRYLEKHASHLDWTVMCPGILHAEAEDETFRSKLSMRVAPMYIPAPLTRSCGARFLAAGLALMQLPRFGVTYKEVASTMLDNLEHDGFVTKQKITLIA